MCAVYVLAALGIIFMNIAEVPAILASIVREAFTGRAGIGGASGITVMMILRTGVKRAAFSNEAGIGTAPMAHGNAHTEEPIAEGLVAMVGPFIDTILICTMTAIVILDKNLHQTTPANPMDPVTSNSNHQMDLLYDEFGLWITASTFEEELDEQMNDLAISEILVLWDDVGWEIENILGQENDRESDTILTRHRVGAFVV